MEALSENETEEPTRDCADKRDVTDRIMTHMKELSNAKSKQGLNQDNCGGCPGDFPIKAKCLGGDNDSGKNQRRP